MIVHAMVALCIHVVISELTSLVSHAAFHPAPRMALHNMRVLAERDGSLALHGVVVYVVVVEHLLDGPSSCGHDVYVGYAGLP